MYPQITALKKKDKPKEMIAQKILDKWWQKNGVKIMDKVVDDLFK